MDFKKIAEENLILKYSVGSKLYGTDTPESDTDFAGIFIADRKIYYGLSDVREVDMSIVSKLNSGKNDKNAIDVKIYEIRKFVKLALDNNPNIIEQLFVPSENAIFSNKFGQNLLNIRSLFPSQLAKQKFLGYAFSQKHKMRIKAENMTGLEEALNHLVVLDPKTYIIENKPYLEGHSVGKWGKKHVLIGDLHIQLNVQVKRAVEQIFNRVKKFGSRKKLIDEFGYDTKFASHLIRLMYEGIELLMTGKLEFPLNHADTIKDIKQGKWKLDEVLKYSEELEDVMNTLKPVVPKKPNRDLIERNMIEIITEFHEEKNCG